MMFRSFPTLTACALTGALLLGGCGTDNGASQTADQPVEVSAGFYPLAWVAERVGGDRVRVKNLTTPGGEPHDLELSIAETATVADSDLIIHEAGMQASVDSAIETVGEAAVLDAAEVVDLRPATDHAAEDAAQHDEQSGGHAEEGHDHGDADPHFWLDPLRMATLGDAVAAELSTLDAAHKQEYADRAAELRADLEALDQEFATGLSTCKRDTVVVSHDAFAYLDKYGLHFEPIAGLSPDAEPTPADLARLQQLIKTEGVTTVFSEELASPAMAESLARDTGAQSAVLDPIEGLSDATASEDYLSLMRTNLAALKKANSCQ